MKMVVCAVFDQAVGCYMTPFFSRSRLEAMRSFETAVKGDPTSMLVQHPQDYALFELGSWDDRTAEYLSLGPPLRLLSAVEVSVKMSMERPDVVQS